MLKMPENLKNMEMALAVTMHLLSKKSFLDSFLLHEWERGEPKKVSWHRSTNRVWSMTTKLVSTKL